MEKMPYRDREVLVDMKAAVAGADGRDDDQRLAAGAAGADRLDGDAA